MADLKDNHPGIPDWLLAKFSIGETNAEECRIIEEWLTTDEKNREYIKKLRLIVDEYNPGKKVNTKEVDVAWSTLQQKIDNAKQAPVYRFNHWWKWRAAAVLLVLIGIAVIRNNDKPGNSQQPLAIHQIVGKGYRNDTLPDGSVILLNKFASVAYDTHFGVANRNIQLNGNCFFSIAHDTSRPFRISVKEITVTVVGTSFSIESDTMHTSIKVYSGIVEVKKLTSSIRLIKGDSIYISATGSTLKKIKVDSIPRPVHTVQKSSTIQVSKDDIQEQKKVITNILADIVAMGIENTKANVEWFSLDNTAFVVNGKKQAPAIYKIFQKKYTVKVDNGFYYGPVQTTGKGVFMTKEELK